MSAELANAFPHPPGPELVGRWLAGPVLAATNALISAADGAQLTELHVAWDLRGRMAGQARQLAPGRGLIRLNRQLFEFPADGHHELRDTALHEMAHLAVFCCWPSARPHGRRWRGFAAALGARPQATHRLPFARARSSTEYAYRVDAGVLWLGAVRHRRLQAGQARYRWRTGAGAVVVDAAAFTGEVRRVGAAPAIADRSEQE